MDTLKILEQKKQQLQDLLPLPKEQQENLDEWFTVELTHSSNAIEGNTLTRIETAEVLERGVNAVIPGKPLKDQLEAINHAKALGFVKELGEKKKGHQFITQDDIKAIHKVILAGFDSDLPGKYRQSNVIIKGTDLELPPPQKVPSLMTELIQWLEGQQEEHPVRIAAAAHFKFVTIHPFRDGNGRTGRLLMNLILLLNNYPMAIIRNEERTEYFAALYKGQTTNQLEPFYNFIEQAVERSLDAHIDAAQGKSIFEALKANGQTEQKSLKIGELAKITEESVPTLRYWTQEGLLVVKEYTPGGYQLYDQTMIERVKTIRRLQNDQRLTIEEIKKKLI